MKKEQHPIPHYIQDYLDWLDIERGLSAKSQENYGRFIKKFTDWLKEADLEKLKPHELTADHVWQYRVYLARKSKPPLKKSTQAYYLIALRSLLNFFATRDILSLPSDKIELPKDKKERQVKFLTLDQLKKLFQMPDTNKVTGMRDRAILELFFSTGMRIAELVALDREQIKIKADTKDLELAIVGKGEKPRTVYVSSSAIKWLREYLAKREDDFPPLFINVRGRRDDTRLTARSIEKMIKKYATAAGLPLNTTPHVLRHSFATDLLNQGVDLRTVQEFLGHSSITATQIYTHVTSKRLRDVHRKFHGKAE